MKKLAIAGASVVALAGAAMPIVGVFAEDDRTVQDTISVQVLPQCTFSAGGDNVTYSASGTNTTGNVSPVNNSSNVHSFTVFCNNNAGYTVKAEATALSQSGVTDVFAYVATLPTSTDGAWHAQFAADSGNTNTLTINQLPAGGAETTIVTSGQASAAAGEVFTATYTAYIGTETPAGTYSGTIDYTLAPTTGS